jgi:hypothetical protein
MGGGGAAPSARADRRGPSAGRGFLLAGTHPFAPTLGSFFNSSLSLKLALTLTSLPAAARRFSCWASVFSKPAGTL